MSIVRGDILVNWAFAYVNSWKLSQTPSHYCARWHNSHISHIALWGGNVSAAMKEEKGWEEDEEEEDDDEDEDEDDDRVTSPVADPRMEGRERGGGEGRWETLTQPTDSPNSNNHCTCILPKEKRKKKRNKGAGGITTFAHSTIQLPVHCHAPLWTPGL